MNLFVLLTMVHMGGTQTSQGNEYQTEFVKFAFQSIINNYDVDKSFSENFFTLLHVVCPHSVQCDNDISQNNTKFNFNFSENLFSDTLNISDELFQNRNKTLIDEYYLEESFRDMQRCCTKCSCSDICREKNNCCLDIDAEDRGDNHDDALDEGDRHDAVTVTQDCISPVSASRLKGIYLPKKFFYMVAECFNTSFGEDINRKCQYPNYTITDEIVPVYSRRSDRIYRNTHCAQCNNDDKVISWKLAFYIANSVNFLEQFEYLNFSDVLNQPVVRNSRITQIDLEPPGEVMEREWEFRCYIPKTIYDKDGTKIVQVTEHQTYFLVLACSYYWSAYEGTFGDIFNDICKGYGNPKCRSLNARSKIDSFSAILVPRHGSFSDHFQATKTNDSPCTCTEYYDKTKDDCRQIMCPPYYAYDDCYCRSIGNINDMMIKIFLEIRPEKPTRSVVNIFSNTNAETLVSKFKTVVNSMFRKTWGPMKLKHGFIYLETANSDRTHLELHTVLILKSKNTKDIMYLLESIYYRLKSGMKLKLLKTPMIMSLGNIFDIGIENTKLVTFDYKSNGTENFAYEVLLAFDIHDLELQSIHKWLMLLKVLFCKRVALNAEETVVLPNASMRADYSLEELAYVVDQLQNQMCLGDFVDIFSQPKSATGILCDNLAEIVITWLWVSRWGILR